MVVADVHPPPLHHLFMHFIFVLIDLPSLVLHDELDALILRGLVHIVFLLGIRVFQPRYQLQNFTIFVIRFLLRLRLVLDLLQSLLLISLDLLLEQILPVLPALLPNFVFGQRVLDHYQAVPFPFAHCLILLTLELRMLRVALHLRFVSDLDQFR